MSSSSALQAAASLLHSLPSPIGVHPAHASAAARCKPIHQRLRLELSMEEGSAQCEAELLLLPLTDEPITHIQINCKHDLDSVTVDGIPARWERVATRSRIDASAIRDARSLELHRHEQLDVAEAGEVRVAIPIQCQRAKSVSIAPPPAPAQVTEEKKSSSMEDEGEEQKDAAKPAAAAEPEIIREPLLLRFLYTLPRSDSRPGLHFLTRSPFAPNRLPQVSTSSSLTSGTSPAHWMPCVDHWEERMTFEISVVCASEFTVLASGVLVGKTVLPPAAAAASPSPAAAAAAASGSSSSTARVRWDFRLDTPVLARSIGFCVAPFVVDLPAGAGAGSEAGSAAAAASSAGSSAAAAASASSSSEIKPKEPTLAWYSVPSRPAGLNKVMESAAAASSASSSSSSAAPSASSMSFLRHKHVPHASTVALLRTTCASTVPGLTSLYEHLFGSPYPFDALRLAFMEEPASLSQHGGFAGLILLDRDLLYDSSLIDQVFTTTEALAYAVALNWLSHTLWLAHAADWWMLQGIAGWAAATYCASVFGTNFVQHGLYLKAQMVLDEDAELGSWFSKPRPEDDADFANEAPEAKPWLRTLESHALYDPAVTSMTEIENTVFRAKAHVVFQMLAQKIGGGILGSSGSATVAVSAGGAGASAGAGGAQPASSGGTVSSGGNVAVRNLIQRLVDEFTYATAAEDTDSAASARPLSTLRLLEICTELSAAGSGIASLSKAVGSSAASSSLSSSELLLTESGQELKSFFDQWVWCNGYPNLDMRFEYKSKNKTTALRIQQRPMWHRGAQHDEINSQVLRFAGPLKCRIVEVERVNDQERLVPAHMGAGMIGTHHSTAAAGDSSAPTPSASSNFTVIEPGSTIEYEFVCSSKVRRNRKRKKLDDASLSLLPIDKLLVRHNDTPLHYARIDPVWSWFALVPSQQDAIHSLWKLNTEKDMLGQLDAIKQVANAWRNHSSSAHSAAASAGAGGIEAAALAAKEAAAGSGEEKMPDDIFPKSLYSTLQSTITFWPVRVAAAQALAESATSGPNAAANYKYLQVLVDWFKARYVDGWNPLLHASSGVMAGAASAMDDEGGAEAARSPQEAAAAAEELQLRANEFSNISEYMVKQSLPLVLSKIRVQPRAHALESSASSAMQASTPPEVVRFLIWLLRDNDNSENHYSDVQYLSALLRSLGNLLFPSDGSLEAERRQVVQEAQRYLNYDQVVPSYHYSLTQEAMMSLAKLERRAQLPSGFTQINFATFAGPAFDRGVRLAAFKSLLTVAPVRPPSDRSFTLVLDVLESESMPGLAHKMMAAWARAVARGTCSGRLLRENCAENSEIMNRLWNIASNDTMDSRLVASAQALWRCVWGTLTVPAALATPAQRAASNVARGTLQAAVKQAQNESQEITARRVARGKHYLRDLRSSREFVPSNRGGRGAPLAAAAAPKRKSIKIIRGTGGFVAAEASEDASQSMDY